MVSLYVKFIIIFLMHNHAAIIVAGVISDRIRSRSVVCVSMLLLAVPAVSSHTHKIYSMTNYGAV